MLECGREGLGSAHSDRTPKISSSRNNWYLNIKGDAHQFLESCIDRTCKVVDVFLYNPCKFTTCEAVSSRESYSSLSNLIVWPPYSGSKTVSPSLTETGINSPLVKFLRPGPTAMTAALFTCKVPMNDCKQYAYPTRAHENLLIII